MISCRMAGIAIGCVAWTCVVFPALAQYHSADTDKDYAINLSELLRVIQFFNSNGFHCETGTEDSFAPGPGDTSCTPHNSDYIPQDWHISLSELLRLIQFFNSSGYHTQCDSEDIFAPGPGSHESSEHTLTYSADANGSISGISPQTVVCGGSGSKVSAIPNPHYHFVQWSDGRTDNPRTDSKMTNDINVAALFDVNGIVYVVQGGDGDGSSWDSPLGSIQEGLNTATLDKEIWVAAGTYTATTDPVVTMKEGFALFLFDPLRGRISSERGEISGGLGDSTPRLFTFHP